MGLLQQNPIVIEVATQPPITPEITYPQVIIGAIGVAVGIMLLAALAGLVTGAIFIYAKKRMEASSTRTETEHVRLRI